MGYDPNADHERRSKQQRNETSADLRAALAAANKRAEDAEAERDAKHDALADQTNAHITERAALETRLAESEAQRALLAGALEFADNAAKAFAESGGIYHEFGKNDVLQVGDAGKIAEAGIYLSAYSIARQALAAQPPSDLVAMVRAAWKLHVNGVSSSTAAIGVWNAVDTLFQNQPGWRALCDAEDV